MEKIFRKRKLFLATAIAVSNRLTNFLSPSAHLIMRNQMATIHIANR